MAVDRELCARVLEMLEPLGDVTGKAMFGGYGYWESGDMFALIDSSSNLYFKVDDASRVAYEQAGSTAFCPEMKDGRSMAMPYFLVPAEVYDDDDRRDEWARTAIGVAHATAKPKAGRSRRAKA